ncbi:MAG: hypothetical protein FWC89_12045 [Defluviitaleaceae bacterium]|nr:hypothetical protein [Defluviitaleaceae bacterium]
MKKLTLLLILCAFCVTLTACGGSEEAPIPMPEIITGQTEFRILWAGNSHTFTGDIPRQVTEMAAAHGITVTHDTILQGGADLRSLRSDVVSQVQSQRYDYVILQDRGGRSGTNARAFSNDVRRLSEAIHETGAIPVLFNPSFNYDNWPDMTRQNQITTAHQDAAQRGGTLFVDVPMAWLYALEQHPNVALFQPTGIHTNNRGAFLTSAVFASTLFGIQVTEGNTIYNSDYVEKLGLAAWEFANR